MVTDLLRERIDLMETLLADDPTLARGRQVMADAMRLSLGQFEYVLTDPDALDTWKKARSAWLDTPPQSRRCNICGLSGPIETFARDKSRPGGYSYRHLSCNRLMTRAYRQ